MKNWTDAAFTAAVLAAACIVSPARGDAPPSRYVVHAQTVLDNETTLTWQRWPPNDGVDDALLEWAGAKDFCSNLDLSGYGWRLPTAKELLTLVDASESFPAIDGTAFPGTAPDAFWSATPLAGNAESAWTVDFSEGSMHHENVLELERVRCVR